MGWHRHGNCGLLMFAAIALAMLSHPVVAEFSFTFSNGTEMSVQSSDVRGAHHNYHLTGPLKPGELDGDCQVITTVLPTEILVLTFTVRCPLKEIVIQFKDDKKPLAAIFLSQIQPDSVLFGYGTVPFPDELFDCDPCKALVWDPNVAGLQQDLLENGSFNGTITSSLNAVTPIIERKAFSIAAWVIFALYAIMTVALFVQLVLMIVTKHNLRSLRGGIFFCFIYACIVKCVYLAVDPFNLRSAFPPSVFWGLFWSSYLALHWEFSMLVIQWHKLARVASSFMTNIYQKRFFTAFFWINLVAMGWMLITIILAICNSSFGFENAALFRCFQVFFFLTAPLLLIQVIGMLGMGFRVVRVLRRFASLSHSEGILWRMSMLMLIVTGCIFLVIVNIVLMAFFLQRSNPSVGLTLLYVLEFLVVISCAIIVYALSVKGVFGTSKRTTSSHTTAPVTTEMAAGASKAESNIELIE